MKLHFFFFQSTKRSHLLLTLMISSFRHIYSPPSLHQEPKQIQQMQKHNRNKDLTNAEDDVKRKKLFLGQSELLEGVCHNCLRIYPEFLSWW